MAAGLNSKHSVILTTVKSELHDRMIIGADIGNCLALLYLSEYANADEFVRSKYRILPIQPVPAATQHERNLFMERITRTKPLLIGFSCYIWNFNDTIALCKEVKKKCSDTYILLGGPEVLDPAYILNKYECIDMIVVGEGEEPFRKLLAELAHDTPDLKSVSALSFRLNDENIINDKQCEPLKPTELPRIFKPNLLNSIHKEVFYESSRGCPNDCKYCAYCLTSFRTLPLERVEEDLKTLLNSKNITHIHFIDSALDLNSNRFISILKILEKNNHRNITSGGFLHLKHIDDNLIDLMYRAGFRDISIGIETFSDNTLNNIGRHLINIDKLAEYYKLESDPRFRMNFTTMYLLPGESYNDFKNTLSICVRAGLHKFFSCRMVILPGTYLYAHPEEYGLVFDPDPPHFLHHCNSFSHDELLKADQLVTNLKILTSFIHKPDSEFLQSQGIELVDIAENIHLYFPEWKDYYTRRTDFDIEVRLKTDITIFIEKYYRKFIEDEDALAFLSELLSLRRIQHDFFANSPKQPVPSELPPLNPDAPVRLRPYKTFEFSYSLDDFFNKPNKIPVKVPPDHSYLFIMWDRYSFIVHAYQPLTPEKFNTFIDMPAANMTLGNILDKIYAESDLPKKQIDNIIKTLYEYGLFEQ